MIKIKNKKKLKKSLVVLKMLYFCTRKATENNWRGG